MICLIWVSYLLIQMRTQQFVWCHLDSNSRPPVSDTESLSWQHRLALSQLGHLHNPNKSCFNDPAVLVELNSVCYHTQIYPGSIVIQMIIQWKLSMLKLLMNEKKFSWHSAVNEYKHNLLGHCDSDFHFRVVQLASSVLKKLMYI